MNNVLYQSNCNTRNDYLIEQYLEIDVNEVLGENEENNKQEQINLFDELNKSTNIEKNFEENKKEEKRYTFYAYLIYKLQDVTTKQLEEMLGITKEALRYYEKEGLIKPERDKNNYRN